jgi:hypothetical protein
MLKDYAAQLRVGGKNVASGDLQKIGNAENIRDVYIATS